MVQDVFGNRLYPFSWGAAGVALFFVISGFCIHWSFRQSSGIWSHFYIRRLFRIVPAYVAALVFVFVIMFRHLPDAAKGGFFWSQFSAHLFFVHNFFPSTFKAVNPPLWSLAVEVQLYLLYPLLLALVARTGWHRTLVLLAAMELFLQGARAWVGGPIFEILAALPFGYWFSWTLGAIIADAFLEERHLPFLKVHPLVWAVLGVSSDFLRPLHPFSFTLWALASAGLISRRLNTNHFGTGKSFFSLKPLTYVGLWSYSLYLLHYPLLDLYFNAVDWYCPQAFESRPLLMLLMFATWIAIIPIAMLWYQVIEKPGIALGKRLIGRHRKPSSSLQAKMENPADSPTMSRFSSPEFYRLSVGILIIFIVGNVIISMQFAPAPSEELADIAWSLATDPNATNRDGLLAVKYARWACRQTGFAQPAFIGVMAAAFAEEGHFDEAIVADRYSSKLAAEDRDTNTLQMNQALLSLYQNHQAYHEGTVRLPEPGYQLD